MVVLIIPSLSFAGGLIVGHITDDVGNDLAGINISIHHSISAEKIETVVTDETGWFYSNELRDGSYKVRLSDPAYRIGGSGFLPVYSGAGDSDVFELGSMIAVINNERIIIREVMTYYKSEPVRIVTGIFSIWG